MNKNIRLSFSLKTLTMPSSIKLTSKRAAVGIVLAFFITHSTVEATKQAMTANYTTGKYVASFHTAFPRVSKIRCAEKCLEAGNDNMCTVAEYDKVSKVCKLSIDDPFTVLDTNNADRGVFFIQSKGK